MDRRAKKIEKKRKNRERAKQKASALAPLERSISRDGVELQICIYREAQTGWFLEIEDHLGGSTVWDEPFPTDQAAYDAAMQAIEEDGASSFIASP